jgi:hypothetical protein
MTIAGELLAVAAQREARHIDEKLFLEILRSACRRDQGSIGTAPMSLLPVEPAWRLGERKDEHRWLIDGSRAMEQFRV